MFYRLSETRNGLRDKAIAWQSVMRVRWVLGVGFLTVCVLSCLEYSLYLNGHLTKRWNPSTESLRTLEFPNGAPAAAVGFRWNVFNFPESTTLRAVYFDGDGKTDVERKLAMVPRVGSLPVNCTKLFEGDAAEIRLAERITAVERLPDESFVDMASDCDAFKHQRRYLTVPVNDNERDFPLAYSIQMYKDVVQLERLLRAIYRPQNVYCINVDKSSPASVHAGVEAIARCFDNVILANVDVAWASFSQVKADLECMRYLYNKSSEWKYLLTLTGQEFPLKTNLDLVMILKALNGSNAMVATIRKRYESRWKAAGPVPLNVTMVKGACHFAVTRGFVHFVLFHEGMKNYTNWAKRTHFPDEHFFQSLGHSPHLRIPGDYTGYPDSFKGSYVPITRFTKWRLGKRRCYGKWVRSVCVYGVGNLQEMAHAYQMFANKFYYHLQPMTLSCLEERHYRWTREDILGRRKGRLNMAFYRNLPQVKHHIPSGLEH